MSRVGRPVALQLIVPALVLIGAIAGFLGYLLVHFQQAQAAMRDVGRRQGAVNERIYLADRAFAHLQKDILEASLGRRASPDAEFTHALETLRKAISVIPTSSERAPLLADLRNNLEGSGEILTAFLRAADAGRASERRLLYEQWMLQAELIEAGLADLNVQNLRMGSAQLQAIDHERLRAVQLTAAALCVVFAGAGFYLLVLRRSVIAPLESLTARAARIAADQAPQPIREAARDDEIGALARTIAEMAGRLLDANAGLREALDVRDEFISMAAHELRTPLTGLLLRLEHGRRLITADGVAEPDRLAEALDICRRQTEQLGRLVAQLLDVTRIRAGVLYFEPAACDAVDVVGDVVDRFAFEARRRGCDVSVTAPPSAPLVGDPGRLDQILSNLLANALRHAAGSPVDVVLTRDEAGYRISVADRGPGLNPDVESHLFEKFAKSKIRHGATGGLGLGLYIAMENAKLHGGTIYAEHRSGGGAVFTVALPVAAAHAV